jgi:hypothetical protein
VEKCSPPDAGHAPAAYIKNMEEQQKTPPRLPVTLDPNRNNPDHDASSDYHMFETLDRLAKKRREALGLPEPEPKPDQEQKASRPD